MLGQAEVHPSLGDVVGVGGAILVASVATFDASVGLAENSEGGARFRCQDGIKPLSCGFGVRRLLEQGPGGPGVVRVSDDLCGPFAVWRAS